MENNEKNVNIQGGAKVDKKKWIPQKSIANLFKWYDLLAFHTHFLDFGGGFDNEKAWKPQNKQNRIFLIVFNILLEHIYKNTFLRSPGLQNITPDAEKSDLSDGIDDISPNPQKNMKKYETHSNKNPKKK